MKQMNLTPPDLPIVEPTFVGGEWNWEANGWPVGWHGAGWFYITIRNPLWFWDVAIS